LTYFSKETVNKLCLGS